MTLNLKKLIVDILWTVGYNRKCQQGQGSNGTTEQTGNTLSSDF